MLGTRKANVSDINDNHIATTRMRSAILPELLYLPPELACTADVDSLIKSSSVIMKVSSQDSPHTRDLHVDVLKAKRFRDIHENRSNT